MHRMHPPSQNFFFWKKNKKNAVLSLKKWKNAVLSLKTAFFLFFFQKKNLKREDVNVDAIAAKLCDALRCEASQLHLKMEPRVKKIFASLQALKDERNPRMKSHLAENVFKAFYFVYQEGNFEARADLVDLLMQTVDVLENCIFTLSNQFDANRIVYYFLLRSGIEFLMQGEWPKEVGLERLNLYCSLTEFDELLTLFKEGSYPTLEVSITASELTRPDFVPKTHWWWYT